jgi:glycosyltransferase involved in cell wall biosynthesis
MFSAFHRIKRIIFRTKAKDSSTFLQNLTGGFHHAPYRALLYYKTEPFTSPELITDYSHTNLWEITEIVRILNNFGFIVDIIDRSRNDFMPEDKYDLFIGLGAGHSGKHFSKYASALPRAIKVLLAAGPEPILSNRLVQEQYDRFNARHATNVPAMRLTKGIDFPSFAKHTDYFLVIGEGDQFSASTYKPLGKTVLTYLPGVSPNVRFVKNWLKTRSRNKFLCFAGNGFICKGVDLVIEAFAEMPELDLYLCGPDTERGFFEVLGNRIRDSKNIKYEGFVSVGGDKFEELLRDCSFVIFASSSEGCATSVATAMRGGLVPILTKEVGINLGSFGFKLDGPKENLINEIRTVTHRAAGISDKEYSTRVYETLVDTAKYTQASFTQTFSRAILRIVQERMS